MRKTKIIATIGPASLKSEDLERMYRAGMNIVRINTKYGSFRQYEKILSVVKNFKNCQVMFDINNTEKIEWIKEQDFDYVAVSYASGKDQIKKIRKLFLPKKVKIISKIETAKGLKNVEGIIDESDGVMVARGDLGKNISFEKVPIAQKKIIRECNAKKKFVITATEMLLSMTKRKKPERAEASDIANAIIDGSNAVMLSEETATGKYPVLVIKTMEKIIDYTEKNLKKIKRK